MGIGINTHNDYPGWRNPSQLKGMASSPGRVIFTFNTQGLNSLTHLAASLFSGAREIKVIRLFTGAVGERAFDLRPAGGLLGADHADVSGILQFHQISGCTFELRMDFTGDQIEDEFMIGRAPAGTPRLFSAFLPHCELLRMADKDISFRRGGGLFSDDVWQVPLF